MELKTTKELTTPNTIQSFERHKLLKFWAQSFLLGVPRIIVGFRATSPNHFGEHGGREKGKTVLASIQMLETMKIPAQIQGTATGMWDGNVCINFAAKFLEFLREVVTEEEGGQGVWSIRFEKGGREISVSRKEGEGTFLTEEYVNWRTKGE
jgi:RAT1-interacting protein